MRTSMELTNLELPFVINQLRGMGIRFFLNSVRDGIWVIHYEADSKIAPAVSQVFSIARHEESVIVDWADNHYTETNSIGSTGHLSTRELLALSGFLIEKRISFDAVFSNDGNNEIMYAPEDEQEISQELSEIRAVQQYAAQTKPPLQLVDEVMANHEAQHHSRHPFTKGELIQLIDERIRKASGAKEVTYLHSHYPGAMSPDLSDKELAFVVNDIGGLGIKFSIRRNHHNSTWTMFYFASDSRVSEAISEARGEWTSQ